jgi:hypothetical protein
MIPRRVATTTIAVLRLPGDEPDVGDDYRDPYDAQPARETVAEGVRAHIGQAGRRGADERVAGGTQAMLGVQVWCDVFDAGLRATDQVLDEVSGELYEVDGRPFTARGFELDHITAPLKQVEGVV